MLKPRCTDEHHRALQHAKRKARTYRKAVLGLAGLLLLSLSGNLASTALTILVFTESRRSADAIPQRPVVLSDSKAAALVGTSLLTSVKDTPDPPPVSVPGLKRCAVAPSGAEACWELADPAVTAIPDGLQGNIAALRPADRIVPTQWLPVLLAQVSLPGPAVTPVPLRNTIYLEHVMKTGGTDACAAHRISRGCKVNPWWNCRLTGYAATRWLNKSSGFYPTHPNITAELVQRGEQSTSSICGIVAVEQGFKGLRRSRGNIRYLSSCSFWHAYTTVLLVRDPWMRFVSHYKMLQLQNAGTVGSGAQPLVPDELLNASNPHSARIWNLWNNFFTKHLVPGFRSTCTPKTLQTGQEVIDRFAVVLNIVDFPLQSAHIALVRLNWSLSLDHEAGAERVGALGHIIFTGSNVHKDYIQSSRRFRTAFAKANTCDDALVAHANARVHRLYRENTL